jgi:ectoine hydroxylase-related dioxygenase (phytanoyl-CoA dioxygenase family)
VIGTQDVETFQRDGVVAARGLLVDWIEPLRDAIPALLETSYDPVKQAGYDMAIVIRANDGMWRKNETFRQFLFESALGDVAAAVMRSNTAQVYEDLLLYREAGPAGGEGEVNWHRDAPRWPLTGDQLSSIWFSLEEVTSDTGAMRFIAGSHHDGEELVSHDQRSPEETTSLADRPVTTVETQPGDAVVFHPRAIHGVYGSAPDRPRRSFTIRFTGDDVRFHPTPKMYHAWMRDCGLQEGDPLDHPWFPVVGHATS